MLSSRPRAPCRSRRLQRVFAAKAKAPAKPAQEKKQAADKASPTWPAAKTAAAAPRTQPLLWATQLKKSHDGLRVQFSGLDFVLAAGSRWAVVGPNGCGKSTLLRCLAGVDTELDDGTVQLRKGTRASFLAQEPLLRVDLPVLDAVLASDSPVLRLVRRYEAAAAAAEAGDVAASHELVALCAEMDAQDGAWTVEADVRTALDKLGCTPLLGRLVGALSGGQLKRVALAATLLSTGPNDILILDEPTNHLSISGVEWLEARLAASGTTLLMVTHDRTFSAF